MHHLSLTEDKKIRNGRLNPQSSSGVPKSNGTYQAADTATTILSTPKKEREKKDRTRHHYKAQREQHQNQHQRRLY